MKKVAINGFGRIGRLTFRNLFENPDVEIVGINDLTDNKTLAHLLKNDSAHGRFDADVKYDDEYLYVNDHKIKATSIRNPEELPWDELQVDVVLECTGIFRNKEKASMHLTAGAQKVIISAPAKGEGVDTIVLGVNSQKINDNQTVYSNASCTTNCFAPLVKIILDNWGIESGSLTTIHGYTSDQRLQDAPHADLRRARAAAVNIIPTTTGAAIATSEVLPAIEGKITAMAMRVPVISGSLVEFNVNLTKEVSVEEVNRTFKSSAMNEFKGILEYSEEELVSSDILGNKHSSIFDSKLTQVNGKLLKVVSWYDNEAGYSARLADLATRV